MRFLETFQTADFIDTLVSLSAAFVLGTLIGAERQYRLRSAGLRTNVLVAVGAAAFVDLAMDLGAADRGGRAVRYTVAAIGVLVGRGCGRKLRRRRHAGAGRRADGVCARRQYLAATTGECDQSLADRRAGVGSDL